jgi:tetratricopeptide (TPR) repeat protein
VSNPELSSKPEVKRRGNLFPSPLFTPEELYRRALKAEEQLYIEIQKGDKTAKQAFSLIFLMYLGILDQCPDDERALVRLYRVATLFTISHTQLNKIMNRVRAHYEILLRCNPRDAEACVRLYQVETIVHESDATAGISWAERALQIDPENSDAHLAIAHVSLARGDSQAARAATDRAIALNPNNVDAYAFRASQFMGSDNLAMIAEYRKCLDLDPTHLEALTLFHKLSSKEEPPVAYARSREVGPTLLSRLVQLWKKYTEGMQFVSRTFSILGTGIKPVHLTSPVGTNFFVELKILGPFCTKAISPTPHITRDFISILYIPLFPLGLSAVVECSGCSAIFRVPLNRYNKKELVEAVNHFTNPRYNLGFKGTWTASALVATGGAILGSIIALVTGTIPPYIIFPAIFAVFGWSVLGAMLDVKYSFGYSNAYWTGAISLGLIGLVISFLLPSGLISGIVALVLGGMIGMSIFSCVFIDICFPGHSPFRW